MKGGSNDTIEELVKKRNKNPGNRHYD